MSHFSVLVIGPTNEAELKAALQPFHEFECTGEDDQYVQDIDLTEEFRKEFSERDDDTYKTFAQFCEEYHGKEPAKAGELGYKKFKYGYTLVDDNGEVIKVIDRTNPGKKWDWWTVGGRWSDQLLFPAGDTGDSGTKGDIDFSKSRKQRAKEASEEHDRASAIIAGRVFESWETIRDRSSSIEDARKEYHSQPVVQDFKQDRELSWDGPDKFAVSRDEYIQAAFDRFPFFAVLKDGQWFEKGKMGWWACVSDEKTPEDWNAVGWRLIEEATSDSMLTVVDCHI